MTSPSICVGLLGPRRAGKSTLLQALLDNENDPTSQPAVETQKLRFAHAEIYKCNDYSSSGSSTATDVPYYRSFGSMLLDMEGGGCAAADAALDDDGSPSAADAGAGSLLEAAAGVSFIDCPGHMGFVPTMLKGIMMSDAVLILSRPKAEAAFSDPPTLEVLAAADLMGKSILVVQSRKDTASDRQLEKHRAQIRRFSHDIIHKEVAIVEVSSRDMSSIGGVCRHIMDTMLVKEQGRDMLAPALMLIGASRGVVLDPVAEAAAGDDDGTVFVTIYGRLVQGVVSEADQVEVRPGVTVRGADGKLVCHPIILKVASVVQQRPCGLLALRATATVADNRMQQQQQQLVWSVLGGAGAGGGGGLEGHVLGHAGSLPGVYVTLKMKFSLVRKMMDPYDGEGKVKQVKAIELNQELLLIIGTMSVYGKVRKIEKVEEEDEEEVSSSSRGGGGKHKAAAAAKKKQLASKQSAMAMVVGGLTPPTCARPGEHILICRRIGSASAWHLVGRGEVTAGAGIPVCYDGDLA